MGCGDGEGEVLPYLEVVREHLSKEPALRVGP